MKREHARRVLNFQEIQRLVPLVDVLERYAILARLKRSGKQLVGCCPIHKGTNRRQFVVDPHKNVWRCFGDCDRGGSTIELVSALEGIEIRQAAELIAQWFAIAPLRSVQHRQGRRKPMTTGTRPAYKVFAVEDKEEGADDSVRPWWTQIGSAWEFRTKDGRDGISIKLRALPIGDRIVLTQYTDDDAAEDEKKAAAKKRK